ncbi:Rossmann-like and DUF2520 domain-containing protein [Hyunsoonleella pacifica]|uniref:DUF2520 domain-containing protein n=1 Tax=Hyunsoonleella pacifica TaxID=1080224 RepID=A0A4Q9FSK3_9FLAO|nr:Rossmann-like and DUF2520 domain-containing protein [Hyunsoonleella pacifica]TBN19118.1 DUF2520 domain-containing protein [Hyunsoonleella pacifica]GGD07446.1 hypothetical protein GCM10011368_06730 [Hyunsoonleella pacifica]
MISVIILGAGNVGTHLFKTFNKSKQITVKQWFNRSLNSISKYKNETNITDDLNALETADVYIISVSDTAVAEISSALPFENRLVVHTAGSINVHDLDKKNRRGVFYPLQSFTKTADLDFSNIPICIETLDKKDYHILKSLALYLGSPVKKVNTDQRKVLHLAAVFVNNFTNQMYRIAHEITESEATEFDLLKPLILETAKKVQDVSPYIAQTGPAKRNDKKTIKNHLKLLEKETHKNIYKLITKSIQDTHG